MTPQSLSHHLLSTFSELQQTGVRLFVDYGPEPYSIRLSIYLPDYRQHHMDVSTRNAETPDAITGLQVLVEKHVRQWLNKPLSRNSCSVGNENRSTAVAPFAG